MKPRIKNQVTFRCNSEHDGAAVYRIKTSKSKQLIAFIKRDECGFYYAFKLRYLPQLNIKPSKFYYEFLDAVCAEFCNINRISTGYKIEQE